MPGCKSWMKKCEYWQGICKCYFGVLLITQFHFLAFPLNSSKKIEFQEGTPVFLTVRDFYAIWQFSPVGQYVFGQPLTGQGHFFAFSVFFQSPSTISSSIYEFKPEKNDFRGYHSCPFFIVFTDFCNFRLSGSLFFHKP